MLGGVWCVTRQLMQELVAAAASRDADCMRHEITRCWREYHHTIPTSGADRFINELRAHCRIHTAANMRSRLHWTFAARMK